MTSVFVKLSLMRVSWSVALGLLIATAFLSAPIQAQERVDAGNGVVVNIADKSLTKKIAVERAQFAKVGPVARVQVTLVNTRKSALNIQYRAQWFDSNGFEISTHDRWEPATIDGQTSRSVDILGNDKDAASVVVNVKAS